MAEEQHLMEKVPGVVIMTLLEMLQYFSVGNSSSYHIDKPKNNFLVLGKGPTDDINDSNGAAEKKNQY